MPGCGSCGMYPRALRCWCPRIVCWRVCGAWQGIQSVCRLSSVSVPPWAFPSLWLISSGTPVAPHCWHVWLSRFRACWRSLLLTCAVLLHATYASPRFRITVSSVRAPPVLMASCLRSWLMWLSVKPLTVLRMSTCATLMPSMLRKFVPTAIHGCGMSALAIHCSASCLVLPTTMIDLAIYIIPMLS